jgi:16S rRNA (guanine527-N7)-methyltransferase
MKGKASGEELEEAKNAISILGGIVEEVISFKLPDDAGERELIVVKKVKSTPAKYPRQFAKIKERPL